MNPVQGGWEGKFLAATLGDRTHYGGNSKDMGSAGTWQILSAFRKEGNPENRGRNQ